ncbi:hypothetical protein KDA_46350 [Dictyobacter alpinus]|uniref:Uncharacterized protein n=1 Tax=Dictyobacter alpinus TaxID=2014873 RepID=A0A402BCM0_9CHLR|nr:hypothetical protein [Dictyobacter alpinus]GCE29151.1 hypothetical protein KDA_46350 [Dictyobacter alpinus]
MVNFLGLLTGEDCFVLKVYLPAIEQTIKLIDSFLLYGSTTTTNYSINACSS